MSALESLATTLDALGELRRDEPLARHTTFGIGGPADLYLTVRGAENLKGAARAARDAGISVFVLGSGSNILVADAGIRGLVIDNRARAERTDDAGTTYRVESGASFAAFSRRMGREGRAGLTWAVGIPGTLGGAVVYNAGAYGGCLADVLRAVRVSDVAGDRWVPADELGLVYRGSAFTRGSVAEAVILEAELELVPADAGELVARAAAFDQKRLAAQPRGRNAGSMFKNPPESPAWKLIDAVGLRGASRGDAAISERHCNFFVNLGSARASDVAWLVEEAERRIYERFGVRLDREVSFVGAWT